MSSSCNLVTTVLKISTSRLRSGHYQLGVQDGLKEFQGQLPLQGFLATSDATVEAEEILVTAEFRIPRPGRFFLQSRGQTWGHSVLLQ